MIRFSKREFVEAVVFGRLGEANKCKQFGTKHEKCTLVYLDKLPDQLAKDL